MKDSFEKLFFFHLNPHLAKFSANVHFLSLPPANTNPVKSSLTFGFNAGFSDQQQPIEKRTGCIF